MIGRLVMQQPWLFRHTDERFFHRTSPRLSRRQIVEKYVSYVERMEKEHGRGLGRRVTCSVMEAYS